MPGRHALVAVMLAICATAADAQSYPVKPIKLIVPYTPGSPVDVLARVVTQPVAARLGQGIVIDNRPGAGTTLGTKMAASAEPDGYTLLIGATSFILSFSLYQNLDYDARSFVPVAMLAHSPQVLVIAPSVPAATVAEFVAYAKANPGRLNFGFGLGTLPQILGESFKVVTGTEIASIPYKGGAQAVTDMLGGRIDMIFGTTATLLPLIQQGKVRALGHHAEAEQGFARRADHDRKRPAATRADLLRGPAGARGHGRRNHRQAQRRDQRSHARTGARSRHGEARLRAANLVAAGVCGVPRRGGPALAADREGGRRESGVTQVSTSPSLDPEATAWPCGSAK